MKLSLARYQTQQAIPDQIKLPRLSLLTWKIYLKFVHKIDYTNVH